MSATLQASLITSFRPLSSVEALTALADLEARVNARLSPPSGASVDTVDLYCFGRSDPALLLPASSVPPPRHIVAWVAGLRCDEIGQIADRLRALLHRPSHPARTVACLATYVPSLSLPRGGHSDEQSPQALSIRALKNLLQLAHRLGASCVEIVCGANFVRYGQQPEQWKTGVGRLPRQQRRDALCEALAELNMWIEDQGWDSPIGLALELEPGLSYLLNRGEEILHLFRQLDQRVGGRARHIAQNLDIGHASLLEDRDPGLRALLWDHLLDRIAHAHISRHVPPAHFADLPLDEATLKTLAPWVELFAASQQAATRCPFATGTIAVELEGAVPPVAAVESYLTLRDWLGRSPPPKGASREGSEVLG